MPLSENEQRILDEIEQHLNTNDPRLSDTGAARPSVRSVGGSLRWSVLAFLVSLGVVVGSLQVHYLAAFVGFLGMLAAGLSMERHIRSAGRMGIDHLAEAIKAANPPQDGSGEP